MAKAKSKRKIADKVRAKKSTPVNKINPFEIKINRQKHKVLGKKVTKDGRGMPGVSKFKAIQKRKETLLVEYKKRGKSNNFVDRRFGETDPEMSIEDKMLERFAKERQKGHDRSGLYNLNDEEELTHYGQSLSEIEKFDNPVSSDDDDDGKLAGELVTEEHFGGFLTKKVNSGNDAEPVRKSWKERMEEIIAKSKKQKYEQQTEKEKLAKQTQELDEQWKTLMHIMSESKRNKANTVPSTTKPDDYDKMVRELQFEVRGNVTDRLKTEEEIAKEEREKLEKLEADRIRRMKGITVEEMELTKAVYRSADDLDDGIVLDKKVRFEVAYKDGKLVTNEDEEDKEDRPGDEDGDADNNSKEKDDDEVNEDESEDSDSDDPMEHMSDLESSDDDDDDEGEDEDEEKDDSDTKLTHNKSTNSPEHTVFLKSSLKRKKIDPEEAKQKMKKRRAEQEAAKKELPYTFEAPKSYEELLGLLQGHSDLDQLVLIERLQKLYHPSLAEGNKQILQTVYTLLSEYYCDLALQDPPLLALMDGLVKHFYQLTQRFPVHSAQTWIQLIRERQQRYCEEAERRNGRGCYPQLDILLVFKLLSVLYPTSDFRHPVVTPAMLFMSQILSQSPVVKMSDVASGLFLSAIYLQYISFAKRFVPEVINFLQGLLFMAVDKEVGKIEPVSPPFKPVGKHINLLKLNNACTKVKLKALKVSEVFSTKSHTYLESDEFRVLAIYQCLKLILQYMSVYQSLAAYKEIFQPLVYFIKKLQTEKYPSEVGEMCSQIINNSTSSSPKTSLTFEKERPKPLKMFEPQFEEKFDGKKKRVGSQEMQEKQRLLHKYKKELKGAIRNLRQDNAFLAKEKLQEQLERDAERKRKVNEIYQDLARQEGDYKAMKREKNKL